MGVFGLTGSLASGKSEVLKLLKAKGAECFNVDKKIHKYYTYTRGQVYKKIKKIFPQCFKGSVISRKKLAGIVFNNKVDLKRLERIIHPLITNDLVEWTKEKKNKNKICVAEVPLLFEKRLEKYFDGVILVTVKKEELIRRIMKKYDFSRCESLNRLKLQMQPREKIKRADYIVNNSLDFKKLEKGVDSLWKKVNQK